MRTLVFLLVALLPVASAGQFGAGEAGFAVYKLPSSLNQADSSGEPTLGIPWETDHVFFQAYTSTHRAVFAQGNETTEVSWTDVTPLFSITNVDPMLHADPVSGRIWAGGLLGPCSSMGISDDNGETWLPSGNMCTGAQFDHQSIGSGPWTSEGPLPRGAVYDRATYYCAQLVLTACTTSIDGGFTWLPFTEVLGSCGGLHGHIRVSEPNGFAAVPDGSCGGPVGFGYTSDNGLTWNSRVVEGSSSPGGGFDPSLNFGRSKGWMYYGAADQSGVHVAMSKDNGQTWEKLGGNLTGVEPTTWLDLGALYSEPKTGNTIKYGAFADMQVGDDDRAFFAFLGTTNPEATNPFDNCGDASNGNIWHYYVAQTFDAGGSWTVKRILEDPVQIGAIWDGGGSDPCRNLLDFNDSDIDSTGRLYIGFADGCLEQCAEKYYQWRDGNGEAPKGSDSRASWGTILRQESGRGVFAAFDQPEEPVAPPPVVATEEKGSPTLGIALVGVGLLALALRRRE